ncbi:MAG: RNA-binding transcriptional accessory protein [Oceanospirillaceae bacterium]|nr:RNA-binding transcriptional accessory protein [Oceanospirillaceae bacterium]MBT7329543.1 RNA-binding transcriptional accessory protein [Oceanospirillaceae bacterium]
MKAKLLIKKDCPTVIAQQIATELAVQNWQVDAAIKLLDEGSTVPFIARYRKEATGVLDDTQLRTLEDRLGYLRELNARRQSILESITKQQKLTPKLAASIDAADSKTRLEDLYLPYKTKRRTKAQIAIEAGLKPLADALYQNPSLVPEQSAQAFLNAQANIDTVKDALDGAKQILMERFSLAADLLEALRVMGWQEAKWQVQVVEGKQQEAAKFQDYFDFQEALNTIPSHRALAILRGRNEGFLQATVVWSVNEHLPFESKVAAYWLIKDQGRPADSWLNEVVRWTWRVKLASQLETALITRVREASEDNAIGVFANNLKDLLLAAPAGDKITLGLDPGLRTGVKAVVVDATGKLLASETIFPHVPHKKWQAALELLVHWCQTYHIALVAIGNGTGSRETDKLVKEVQARLGDQPLQRIIVSEAGASIYSASALAAAEFPDLDVSYRGAVSIARRLQDPLAELVKIEPKAIGVGQYQHDVSQVQLTRRLDNVVEDCVNNVGVDLNTASAPLLQRVAGLNKTMAENIVLHRELNGAFANRKQLLKVARLGAKAYEQAAGFLRIRGGDNPLDGTSVHPEAYALVDQVAGQLKLQVSQLIGNEQIKKIRVSQLQSESFGAQTVQDLLAELQKPGRDPRPEFRMAKLTDGVESIKDLILGALMEGTISNVTNFGAFVDLGVHQDGLVHISALSKQFVKDTHSVVKAGDIVKVKIMQIDVARKRIGLSMRLDDELPTQYDQPTPARPSKKEQPKPVAKVAMGSMAQKLKEAQIRAKGRG